MSDILLLKPKIEAILTAPGTDLNTISAKRVRKQLVEDEPELGDLVKNNKTELDLCIAEIFHQVSHAGGSEDGVGAGASTSSDSKRKYDEYNHGEAEEEEEEDYNDDDALGDDDDDDDDDEERNNTSKKSRPVKKSKTDKDEALARQLSMELNGRTSSRRGANGSSNRPGSKHKASPKKKKRKGISAATIDTDSDSEGGRQSKSPSKKKSRAANGGGGGGGFSKEMNLSEPLAAVLQTDKLPRTQVVKQLWVYIKAHELQNPSNKREIMCDPALKAVFNVDKIDMFKMNKVLGLHLRGPEE